MTISIQNPCPTAPAIYDGRAHHMAARLAPHLYHLQTPPFNDSTTPSPTPSSNFGPDNSTMGRVTHVSGVPGFDYHPYHAIQAVGRACPLSVGGQDFGASQGLQSHRSLAPQYMPTPTPMAFHPSSGSYMATMDINSMEPYSEYDGSAPSASASSRVTSISVLRRRDPTFPTDEETEEYLRKSLSIPPTRAVNLWALPNEPFNGRPPKISDQIKLAIWGGPTHKLTLRQIYQAVEARYPSRKTDPDKAWQRSIRHNLSLKAMFIRLDRPKNDPGKGHYWALDVREGDGNQRDRKRSRRDDRDEDGETDISSESQAGSPAPFMPPHPESYQQFVTPTGYSQQGPMYTPYPPPRQGHMYRPEVDARSFTVNMHPSAADSSLTGHTDPPFYPTTTPWVDSPPLNHPSGVLANQPNSYEYYQQEPGAIMDGIPHLSLRRQHYFTSPEDEDDDTTPRNAPRHRSEHRS